VSGHIVFIFDGKVINVDSEDINLISYNNRIYLPLRSFCESVGATIEYSQIDSLDEDISLMEIFLDRASPPARTELLNDQTNEMIAPGSLTAFDKQTDIIFHFVDDDHEYLRSNVLYYQDRTYVPLRAFTEAIGTKLNYQEPVPENGYVHFMQIYSMDDEFTNHDPYGYVSIGQLTSIRTENGGYELIGGKIRINKDLDDKMVNIMGQEIQDGMLFTNADGNQYKIDFLNPIFIDNELTEPLMPGDIRSFVTPSFYTQAYSSIDEFAVRVANPVVVSARFPARIPSIPLYFEGDIARYPDEEIKVGQPIYVGYSILCMDEIDTVESFEIVF
jgi:hypothetical protein